MIFIFKCGRCYKLSAEILTSNSPIRWEESGGTEEKTVCVLLAWRSAFPRTKVVQVEIPVVHHY